jgi:hypothetical protein
MRLPPREQALYFYTYLSSGLSTRDPSLFFAVFIMRTKDRAAILTDVVDLGNKTRNPIHSTLSVGLHSLR